PFKSILPCGPPAPMTASSLPCAPTSAGVQSIWMIHARNGEVVRIVFVIDACDREIIAWSAVANAGISGEMVCDLMSAAGERRFQALGVRHRLEWLSDNGSAYITRQTAQVAAALGID